MRTETDMTKLIIALSNFAKVPKIQPEHENEQNVGHLIGVIPLCVIIKRYLLPSKNTTRVINNLTNVCR